MQIRNASICICHTIEIPTIATHHLRFFSIHAQQWNSISNSSRSSFLLVAFHISPRRTTHSNSPCLATGHFNLIRSIECMYTFNQGTRRNGTRSYFQLNWCDTEIPSNSSLFRMQLCATTSESFAIVANNFNPFTGIGTKMFLQEATWAEQ